MTTVPDACRTLTGLITSGSFAGGRLPSERELGEVLGVSRTTVRKVLDQLAKDGVLARSPTGRAQVLRGHEAGRLRRIAFIAPAFASTGAGRWEDALRQTLERHPGVHLASLRFRSWDEPLFREAARGCDGVFLLPGGESPTDRVRQALVGPGAAPVASLGIDLSAWGVPSLMLHHTASVHQILDRMHELGHRRIGWLNSQPVCSSVAARTQAFQVWMAAHRLDGPLVSDPVAPFQDPTRRGHSLMRRCLDQHPDVTAWLCSVIYTARGAIRAIHDRGMVAGRELSIATIDGEQHEDFCVPTLACAAAVDPEPYLALCVQWMLAGPARSWHGPLLVQPAEPRFHPGESLGPVHLPIQATP